MTTIQDVLDAICAAGAADHWQLADEIANEHGVTGCRMCFVAKRLHPSVKKFVGLPAVANLFCEPCFDKYLEQHRPVQTIKIYARPDGCDMTGDGSRARPYATFARAQRDLPQNLQPGCRYAIDITGINETID